MLQGLGFEVYVPKMLPTGPNSRTSLVTTEYDASLSIPDQDVQYLNTVNFYESPISKKTADIINRHFSDCICAYIYPGLHYISRAFKGNIYMRAFGHAGDMDYETATSTVPKNSVQKGSYSPLHQRLHKLFHSTWNRRKVKQRLSALNDITLEMYTIRKRLYLAASYQEIIENERSFLKERSLYLPLAIPPSIERNSETWEGGEDKILFVCPNIDQIPYYRQIYLGFKEALGHLPHVIAGRQDLNGVSEQLSTSDPSILGYVARSKLDELMRTCSCMFYHSQEERHLHYHPLEAIVAGMPLVFMGGGLLESLSSDEQPGLCRTTEEARGKIERLLGGDSNLRNSIKTQQKSILKKFHTNYCTEVWRQTFVPIARGGL